MLFVIKENKEGEIEFKQEELEEFLAKTKTEPKPKNLLLNIPTDTNMWLVSVTYIEKNVDSMDKVEE